MPRVWPQEQQRPQVHTSWYVGIDDFAKKKGHVYACTIVDHYTRDTLAVFDSRYGSEIREWIVAHPEIRLVTRDGSQSYADIITAASADIIQVSDRFHLIKNLKDTAVELVRDVCIHFCDMIHNKEGAPGISTWIKEAMTCQYIKIHTFAQYIKNDAKAVEQACLTNFSNALLEGNVNRAKAVAENGACTTGQV